MVTHLYHGIPVEVRGQPQMPSNLFEMDLFCCDGKLLEMGLISSQNMYYQLIDKTQHIAD